MLGWRVDVSSTTSPRRELPELEDLRAVTAATVAAASSSSSTKQVATAVLRILKTWSHGWVWTRSARPGFCSRVSPRFFIPFARYRVFRSRLTKKLGSCELRLVGNEVVRFCLVHYFVRAGPREIKTRTDKTEISRTETLCNHGRILTLVVWWFGGEVEKREEDKHGRALSISPSPRSLVVVTNECNHHFACCCCCELSLLQPSPAQQREI